MSVYLNVKDEVAQNKLHHKIPNLLGFIFQFLDLEYVKYILREKRIFGVGLKFPKTRNVQYFKIVSWRPSNRPYARVAEFFYFDTKKFVLKSYGEIPEGKV